MHSDIDWKQLQVQQYYDEKINKNYGLLLYSLISQFPVLKASSKQAFGNIVVVGENAGNQLFLL